MLSLPIICNSQEWTKYFNNINPEFYYGLSNVEQTFDQNFVAFTGIGIMKIDLNGDTLWSKEIPKPYTKDGVQTSDGGYILIGYGGVFKLNSFGDIQWTSDIFCEPTSIEETADGGYIYTGTRGGAKMADEHTAIIRLNSFGDTIWTTTVHRHNPNYHREGVGRDIDVLSDGNYIVAGLSYLSDNNSGPTHGELIKINDFGDTLWTKRYLFQDDTRYNSVVENSFGNFVSVGSVYENIGNSNCGNIIISETDNSGNLLWVKIYEGDVCGSEAYSVENTSDGGYIICGTKRLVNNEDVLWLLKTNNQGDTLWTKTFGNPYGFGFAAKQLPNQGYIILGAAWQNSFSASMMLIKTNSFGNITSTTNFANILNPKLINKVDFLGREINDKSNQPLIYIYDDGTVEKKLIIE